MKSSILETVIGAIILAIVFIISGYIYINRGHNTHEQSIYANFSKCDGIAKGSDIRISGVKVGNVTNIDLDRNLFCARVKLGIDSSLKVPVDSSCAIASDGLFGGKFINLNMGGSSQYLEEGETIQDTQSGLSLEGLINKFLFKKS